MKKAYLFLLLFLSTLFSTVQGASFPAALPGPMADSTLNVTISQRAPKALENGNGQKLRWYERLSLKILQKKLEKHGREDVQPVSQSTKVLSVVSLVASALAVVMLIAGVGIGFFIFVLMGLVTGIIGLAGNRNKGNKHRTMAILGIVISGAALLLILAALIAWASAWN